MTRKCREPGEPPHNSFRVLFPRLQIHPRSCDMMQSPEFTCLGMLADVIRINSLMSLLLSLVFFSIRRSEGQLSINEPDNYWYWFNGFSSGGLSVSQTLTNDEAPLCCASLFHPSTW